MYALNLHSQPRQIITLLAKRINCFTWLSNFEKDISFTPDVDGSEGKCSSTPPTTYDKEDARRKNIFKKLASTRNYELSLTGMIRFHDYIPLLDVQMEYQIRSSTTACYKSRT